MRLGSLKSGKLIVGMTGRRGSGMAKLGQGKLQPGLQGCHHGGRGCGEGDTGTGTGGGSGAIIGTGIGTG